MKSGIALAVLAATGNLELSRRRAQSARDCRAAKGVAPGRVTAVGYGAVR
jgi:outer membrane protein OmpA-like peptidoglycan-associated protein